MGTEGRLAPSSTEPWLAQAWAGRGQGECETPSSGGLGSQTELGVSGELGGLCFTVCEAVGTLPCFSGTQALRL